MKVIKQGLQELPKNEEISAFLAIHDMHRLTLHHGPSSRLVASDVLTDFTSLTTNQLLGLQKTLQWCIS